MIVAPKEQPIMASPKHILVAVDFNEVSERALDYALTLAKSLGAKVTVIHVYALPIYRFADSEYVPSADEATRITAAAQKGLDALIARHAASGVPMSAVVHSGTTAEEICSEATHAGADLIVMGTHGRGALSRVLLGSVAQNVIRISPIPVLTVRGQGA